ncbi:hypothetical protein [Algibacter sp. PT7-4]|uniref:hypothetical protein n=1 Tax=Algibacter ulvanivorans TaxID=3400999 RepID=UPI003AACEA67
MPRITMLIITSYLENIANNHALIQDKFRWNISEVTGQLRKGVNLPFMAIDAVETKTTGDKTKIIHLNSTAFTILGKPNTKTGNLDQYEAQNQVLEYCQNICFDIENRILHDAQQIKDAQGNKNWLYGLVDQNSFHHFKVGPLYAEGLYGYRCEITLKNQSTICVEKDKWNDLN